MPEYLPLLIVAIVMVPISGFFAALDTALVTVSKARVDDLVKDGRAGAATLVAILPRRANYVALTVFLRVVCEAIATACFTVFTVANIGVGWGLLVAIVVAALINYVAIGIGPRTLGRQHAYSLAIPSSYLLKGVGVLLGPLTRLLILVGNAITPGKGYRNGPFATEVELRELVDLAEARGVVDADERKMIQSVFDLGDTLAREVMVPRPEMIWIEADKTAAQAMSLAVRSGHSRIPVIGENSDDVLGVVYLKDCVEQTLAGNREARVLVADLMRPAEFVPDTKPLDQVLADMQRIRNHMALLVDEYGGIAGLVTIEDVLEEIVGEINDEYDSDEPAPVTETEPGVYRLSSRLPIEDLGELFDVEIDEEDVDTVGGLVGLILGRVPLPGARVEKDGIELVAEGGTDRKGRLRITSVIARRVPGVDDDTDSASREPGGNTTSGDRVAQHDGSDADDHSGSSEPARKG